MTTYSMSRHAVSSGDAELYVEQHGTGPDVLLIAGLGDTVEVWESQIDALSDRFRLTTFDNRGVGRTSAPVDSISIEAWVRDTAAVVEALRLDRPHVMGFSGGGVIGQHLALERPDLVRSLVLCGSFGASDELLQRRFDSWLALADASESPEAFLRHFLSSVYTRAAHADGRVDAWIDEFLAFPHPMSDEAFAASLDALRSHDVLDRLPSLDVPALVIHGSDDANSPLSHGRDLAARIPGAELVVMDGQGHQPFQEVPEAYNALVAGFWEGVRD